MTRGLAHRLWGELFLLIFVGIPVGAAVATSHTSTCLCKISWTMELLADA